jgi:hypothetical protein
MEVRLALGLKIPVDEALGGPIGQGDPDAVFVEETEAPRERVAVGDTEGGKGLALGSGGGGE